MAAVAERWANGRRLPSSRGGGDNRQGEERAAWEAYFDTVPTPLTAAERKAWMHELKGVSLSSDAFFPFSDNIHRAHQSGVAYVVAPSGSVQDNVVIGAADAYGMTVCHTDLRLFHH